MDPVGGEQPQLPSIHHLLHALSVQSPGTSTSIGPTAPSHIRSEQECAERWIEDGLRARSEDVFEFFSNLIHNNPHLLARYLSGFPSAENLHKLIAEEVLRISENTVQASREARLNVLDSKTEWREAITQVPDVDMAWKDDPKAFWKYMTGEVPPADPNKFLKWGYQNNGLLRPRAWYGRMFIMVISGNIIRKLHTEDEVQAAGIDQVVGRIIGATSAKGQRYRLAVTKYHKFVTALGVGAAFCGKISDKAERIGSRDLDEVLERCKEEKLYDQFLRKYEKIAFNIIQCVGLD